MLKGGPAKSYSVLNIRNLPGGKRLMLASLLLIYFAISLQAWGGSTFYDSPTLLHCLPQSSSTAVQRLPVGIKPH